MNDLSARQWRLDTPTPFGNPNALLWPGNIYVKQMVFQDYPVATNNAVIKDRNGKVVWAPTGAADLSPIRIADIGWVEGMILDTLTGSGSLVTVYVK